MIIFGWRGVTFNKEQGQFHCPSCGPNIDFRHKTVRNFFTLYFIPVIPLNSLGEYVECQQCQGTFHHDILDYDPAEQGRTTEAIFMVAAKQLMISMLLAWPTASLTTAKSKNCKSLSKNWRASKSPKKICAKRLRSSNRATPTLSRWLPNSVRR